MGRAKEVGKLVARCTFVLSVLLVDCVSSNLHQQLRYYETLNTHDVIIRRRSAVNGISRVGKDVSFRAFGRWFRLVLLPGTPALAADFQASTIDETGKKTPIFFDPQNIFFTGHVAENESVTVTAHFEDGLLSATVYYPDEVYVVEPAWRHLPKSCNCTMLVYRASDLLWDASAHIDGETGGLQLFPDASDLTTFGKNQTPLYDDAESAAQDPLGHVHQRPKRASQRKSCNVLVVVDYTFYKDVGITPKNTASYIGGIFQNANTRFKNTEWDANLKGYGVHLASLHIHKSYTPLSGHYNENKEWDAKEKLMAFFQHTSDLSEVCLGHLYTSTSFSDGTLGLASRASAEASDPNGICGNRFFSLKTFSFIRLNGGFSSAQDRFKRILTKFRVELVTSHEIGHNWGATHDPKTAECGPSYFQGGKYLMWYAALSGTAPNNGLFSSCSKRTVAPVLRAKASRCFMAEPPPPVTSSKPPPPIRWEFPPPEASPPQGTGANERTNSPNLCGNAVLDEGEECDEGLMDHGPSQCCTSACTLNRGAVCSDWNSGCCTSCQVAAAGTKCAGENELVCRKAALCDGKKLTCPEAEPLKDKSQCAGKGQCHGGKCMSYCHMRGKEMGVDLEPCLCDQSSADACRQCCSKPANASSGGGSSKTCEPTEEFVVNGRPCEMGYCEDGVCVTLEANLVVRFFQSNPFQSIGHFAAFMKTNIVLMVVLFSLFIFVPARRHIDKVDKHVMDARAALLAAVDSGWTTQPRDLPQGQHSRAYPVQQRQTQSAHPYFQQPQQMPSSHVGGHVHALPNQRAGMRLDPRFTSAVAGPASAYGSHPISQATAPKGAHGGSLSSNREYDSAQSKTQRDTSLEEGSSSSQSAS